MPVQTTREIEKTMRRVCGMAEVQRDSYEALAENIADAQRRGMKLAEGGFRFMRLQEENARVTREWFANSMRLVQLQQRTAEFAQGWTSEAVKAVREQTQQNARTAEAIAQSVRKQQESFGALTQQWVGAYRNFFSPFAYFQEGVRITQQGLEATEEAARQGLRIAHEAAEQTEKVLEQTEQARPVRPS